MDFLVIFKVFILFVLTIAFVFSDGGSASNKWTNLRNQYGKLKKASKQPSGSGQAEQPVWAYYKSLSFLDSLKGEREGFVKGRYKG